MSREMFDLGSASAGELLGTYSAILAELRGREIIRTNNPPAGDYAEWLVSRALGAPRLEANSTKSYDLVDETYERVQVKARLVSTPVKIGQLETSIFASAAFDHAALVLLEQATFKVHRAVLLPLEAVRARWKKKGKAGGHILHMNGPTMSHREAIDITDTLRIAASRID